MRDGLNGYGGGGLQLFAVHMNGMLAEACLKAGQPESAALALDAAALIEDSGGLLLVGREPPIAWRNRPA